MGGGDGGLGRHATVVQAVASHAALLEQQHRGAHLRCAGSHGEPAGAAADHRDIDPDRFRHPPVSLPLGMPDRFMLVFLSASPDTLCGYSKSFLRPGATPEGVP